MFNIIGYNQFARCNDSYRSGGVIVFVSENYVARSANVELESADATKVSK